ncbi:hypothetical protein UFOVP325_118 [uncultured Caudovirales phage]|uniref:Baseplate hub assembly protein, bacteriophage T4-like n=1 Tax=uncultured Caudovirales phage TaxID=2100421 RepID=A0A6J5MWV2_9CAUD|nr:hypothetical protein UFOVP325_118 [uncultured Caudovirales phage]CAB4148129.1 hypothetical protein UFOVP430_113 [uncultured Caudovirales phage]
MAEQILRATDDANKANNLIAQALTEPQVIEAPKIVAPTDILVDLPGGTIIDGEVVKTAVVRELNGKDEEAIIRADNSARMFSIVVNRATVSLGDTKATDELLDRLLVGDRDALLLGIYRATFGDTAELSGYCEGCSEFKPVEINIVEDIKHKILPDARETDFFVQGKNKEFRVSLPTGITQKKILANPEATMAESLTTLLEQTVIQIDGKPVFGKSQIQALGLVDRRAIADEIADRNPGPQFDPVKVTCPDCESEVQVPISLGSLFRF